MTHFSVRPRFAQSCRNTRTTPNQTWNLYVFFPASPSFEKKNRQKKRTDSNNQPLFLLQTGLQSDGVKLSISFSFPKTSLKKKSHYSFNNHRLQTNTVAQTEGFCETLRYKSPESRHFWSVLPVLNFLQHGERRHTWGPAAALTRQVR